MLRFAILADQDVEIIHTVIPDAYALDVLQRLSVAPDAPTGTLWQCCNRNPHPLDGSCSEQRGRTQDAVKDADAQVELATRITETLRPLIAEIAADPGGEWLDGAADSTMQRLYANIIREVTR